MSNTKFSANSSLLSDASELDALIFTKGQSSITRDLNEFVQEFETKQEILSLDSLAKTFVQLTNCEQKLKTNIDTDTTTSIRNKMTDVEQDLNKLLDSVRQTQERKKNDIQPFEMEKEVYLQARSEKKKKMENDIRREADKIDEYYTKKTRDSLYRNLVGHTPQ